MFELAVSWWEPIVRVAIIYAALHVALRLTGKRQMGQITPMDLLTILLVAEAVSPALTGGDDSVSTGLIAAGTLFAITAFLSVLTYRSRFLERWMEGKPAVLYANGKLDRRVMAMERITEQEIETSLRKNGHASLDDVRIAVVEPSGEISFVPQQ